MASLPLMLVASYVGLCSLPSPLVRSPHHTHMRRLACEVRRAQQPVAIAASFFLMPKNASTRERTQRTFAQELLSPPPRYKELLYLLHFSVGRAHKLSFQRAFEMHCIRKASALSHLTYGNSKLGKENGKMPPTSIRLVDCGKTYVLGGQ